jgi:PHD/YefM family antitoxin component YafN of YafNO toxin-antitoxin module
MVSVSEIKREYSKILKKAEQDLEPIFVIESQHTPNRLLMPYHYYESLIIDMRQNRSRIYPLKIERLEDMELYTEAEKRLKNDSPVWVAAEKVFEYKSEGDNPYSQMSDEELFD